MYIFGLDTLPSLLRRRRRRLWASPRDENIGNGRDNFQGESSPAQTLIMMNRLMLALRYLQRYYENTFFRWSRNIRLPIFGWWDIASHVTSFNHYFIGFFKKGQPRPIFHLPLCFQTQIGMWKNVHPRFKLTTFGTWVSYHNH